MVLSMLLLLVLGLVIVVPKLAWRECPRLNGIDGDGEDGDMGVTGALAGGVATGSEAVKILGGNGGAAPFGTVSSGVGGNEIIVLPSSEFTSNSSGGSLSFSISDFRLNRGFELYICKRK